MAEFNWTQELIDDLQRRHEAGELILTMESRESYDGQWKVIHTHLVIEGDVYQYQELTPEGETLIIKVGFELIGNKLIPIAAISSLKLRLQALREVTANPKFTDRDDRKAIVSNFGEAMVRMLRGQPVTEPSVKKYLQSFGLLNDEGQMPQLWDRQILNILGPEERTLPKLTGGSSSAGNELPQEYLDLLRRQGKLPPKT